MIQDTAAEPPLRILVIDDDEIDRLALQRAIRLSQLSAVVSEEVSPSKAVARLRSEQFDCIFLDFRLPQTDGLAVLREIRSTGVITPIIAYTGHGDEALAVQMLKAGVSDYIPKTMLTPDGVSQSIRSALRIQAAERMTAESIRRLEESERRHRTILESSLDPFLVIDDNGTVEWANQAATELFELPCNVLTGLAVSSLLGGGGDEWQQRQDRKYHRLTAHPHSGQRIPVEVSVARTVLAEQRKTVLNIRDIRDRVELEKMKNEFVSMVSHELRTPVASILGSLRLVSGGAVGHVPPDIKALIDIGIVNGERLLDLLNDLLDIEKIEAGGVSLDFVSCDLEALARETVRTIDGYASRFGVQIELRAEPVQAVVDRNRIAQVLTNLLSNGIKWSPKGEAVVLTLATQEGSPCFTISDAGPGIPEAFQDKIFGKFQQADSSAARKKGGTGLGLAISKAIIELHGGSISFQSVQGRGTTFRVRLPSHPPAELPQTSHT